MVVGAAARPIRQGGFAGLSEFLGLGWVEGPTPLPATLSPPPHRRSPFPVDILPEQRGDPFVPRPHGLWQRRPIPPGPIVESLPPSPTARRKKRERSRFPSSCSPSFSSPHGWRLRQHHDVSSCSQDQDNELERHRHSPRRWTSSSSERRHKMG